MPDTSYEYSVHSLDLIPLVPSVFRQTSTTPQDGDQRGEGRRGGRWELGKKRRDPKGSQGLVWGP